MKFDGITRSNIVLVCTNYIIVLTKKKHLYNFLQRLTCDGHPRIESLVCRLLKLRRLRLWRTRETTRVHPPITSWGCSRIHGRWGIPGHVGSRNYRPHGVSVSGIAGVIGASSCSWTRGCCTWAPGTQFLGKTAVAVALVLAVYGIGRGSGPTTSATTATTRRRRGFVHGRAVIVKRAIKARGLWRGCSSSRNGCGRSNIIVLWSRLVLGIRWHAHPGEAKRETIGRICPRGCGGLPIEAALLEVWVHHVAKSTSWGHHVASSNLWCGLSNG